MCKVKDRKRYEDAIRGSLIGGAVGDALGYPVEFSDYEEIIKEYGESGIVSYELEDGTAVVSDDTQMTMFTATGILCAHTECQKDETADVEAQILKHVWLHYKDWLHTQYGSDSEEEGDASWLMDLDRLYALRAPGGTCLTAIGDGVPGTIENPINDRKGCGGIMRVAPAALYSYSNNIPDCWDDILKIDRIGAGIAALTHGHSLGYIPSAATTHIVRRAVYGGCTLGDSLYDITEECRMAMSELFEGDAFLQEFLNIFDYAVELAGNQESDIENIKNLGGGWVAEETFAISLYCSLRYADDFTKAMIAAVNHSGDADSTGAVTGNIVGALVGYDHIADKWKENLEFHDILLELADDLCYTNTDDECWSEKYGITKCN